MNLDEYGMVVFIVCGLFCLMSLFTSTLVLLAEKVLNTFLGLKRDGDMGDSVLHQFQQKKKKKHKLDKQLLHFVFTVCLSFIITRRFLCVLFDNSYLKKIMQQTWFDNFIDRSAYRYGPNMDYIWVFFSLSLFSYFFFPFNSFKKISEFLHYYNKVVKMHLIFQNLTAICFKITVFFLNQS